MKSLKAIVKGLQESHREDALAAEFNEETEYQKFFSSALKKFNVKTPAELEGDKKKKFYDYVDANWKGEDEEKELDEAVRIDTGRYKNIHGKNPSGRGMWAFSSKRRGDVDYDNKKEFFMSSGSTSYEDAVKQAKEWGEKNGHLYVYVMESTEDLTEVLSKSDPIEDWIKDFIDSKNPKFAGKSKAERIEMAKGAYYGAQKK